MNDHVMQTLEYEKIKDQLASYALSRGGKERIEGLQPSVDIAVIEKWLLETTEARQIIDINPSVPLSSMVNVDEILLKAQKSAVLSPLELANLKDLLESVRRLRKFMLSMEYTAPLVSRYATSMFECLDLWQEIERCISNLQVSDRATAELGGIRKKLLVVDSKIKQKLNSVLSSPALAAMIQEALVSTRNGRYVVPVKKEHRRNFPGTVLDVSSSGATVFMEPSSVARLQTEYDLLQAEEQKEVWRILVSLSEAVAAHSRELSINLEAMVHYDFLFAKARYSKHISGIAPMLNTRNEIMIIGGRHPLLGPEAVPLDMELGKSYRALIVTGPNTGGKTVALKSIGLLTLMAQSGLHIPAREGSELGVFADIRTDIGDGQSIEQSLSTFSAHVRNIAHIIDCADPNTLVLMDELGAGTDPGEGMGFAIAVLEEVFARGASIVATTHISEIKEFARYSPGFENGSMAFDPGTLQPLYRLIIGRPGDSHAFLIALRMGIDRHIVERAHEITYNEKRYFDEYSLFPSAGSGEDATEAVHRILVDELNAARVQEERSLRQTKNPAASFQIGDRVYISTMKRTGVVCEPVNSRGEVVVMVMKKKFRINHKRLSLHLEAQDLYPENYDLDIILESKENRKKRKIMTKHHIEGNIIETPPK